MSSITTRVVRRARRHYGLTVYTRHRWGSTARNIYAQRRRTRPVARVKADTLVQHITVTRPSGDLRVDARTVERIGLERFGSGVSYNFLLDMATGAVAVGQALDAKGTHTVNAKGVPGYSYDQNSMARAIAVVGMPDTTLTDQAEEALARLIAAMIDAGALTPDPDYVPHSLFAWKDCPCDPTRSRMPAIKARAQFLADTGRRPRPLR